MVARELGREGIGIDLNPEYLKLAYKIRSTNSNLTRSIA
jgi:DNA modification methylase